jgi:ABC-2 type transport system ATP-binding protein
LRPLPPPQGTAPGLARYRLTAPDRAALNAALDALRAEGVEFEAVQPLRQSLEDTFVEVVTAIPDAQPGPAASGEVRA